MIVSQPALNCGEIWCIFKSPGKEYDSAYENEVKLGTLLRIRSHENIAGGFLFTSSFQSPKNPIFSMFVDT